MRYLGWIKGNGKKTNTKISNIGGNKKKTVFLLHFCRLTVSFGCLADLIFQFEAAFCDLLLVRWPLNCWPEVEKTLLSLTSLLCGRRTVASSTTPSPCLERELAAFRTLVKDWLHEASQIHDDEYWNTHGPYPSEHLFYPWRPSLLLQFCLRWTFCVLSYWRAALAASTRLWQWPGLSPMWCALWCSVPPTAMVTPSSRMSSNTMMALYRR